MGELGLVSKGKRRFCSEKVTKKRTRSGGKHCKGRNSKAMDFVK